MPESIIEKFYYFFQGIMLFQVLFFGGIYYLTKRRETLIYSLLNLITAIYYFNNPPFEIFGINGTDGLLSTANLGIVCLMVFLYMSFVREIFIETFQNGIFQKMYLVTSVLLFFIFVSYCILRFYGIKSDVLFFASHVANYPLMLYVMFVNFRISDSRSLVIKAMVVTYLCLLVTIYFSQENAHSNMSSILSRHPLLIVRIGMLIDIFLYQIALLMRWNEQERALVTKDFENKLAIEKMRNSISEQLHDDVGANLSSLNFLVELLMKKTEKAEEVMNKITNNITETATLLSDTIWAIKPDFDSFQKLLERVNNFSNNLLLSHDISFQHRIRGETYSVNLNSDQKRDLYLTLKEGLNNIAKHSGASKVDMEIESMNEILTIELKDNGIGFDAQRKFEGNGLKNFGMRKNLSVNIVSELGKGTTLKIILKPQNH